MTKKVANKRSNGKRDTQGGTIRSADLRAEISIEPGPGRKKVVTLTVLAKTTEDMKLLDALGWGKLQDVDALRYCHTNTVYPHSIGGNGDGKYKLEMTVNFDPWKQKSTPSVPQK